MKEREMEINACGEQSYLYNKELSQELREGSFDA
jgi:hypothetical protein